VLVLTVEGLEKPKGGRSGRKSPAENGKVLVVCIAPKDARECRKRPFILRPSSHGEIARGAQNLMEGVPWSTQHRFGR